MYHDGESSSSPVQTENDPLMGSFINGHLAHLIDDSPTSEKKKTQQPKLVVRSNGTSIVQKKKPLRNSSSNCDLESDSALLKVIPQLNDRFISVVDSVNKEPVQLLMCRSCRCLLKKNADVLSGHMCREKDAEKFINVPILNNQLIFRSKPKNRASDIWNEFEEVFEPTSSMPLGYARCKRCYEIVKTPDPKSVPSILRKHQCPYGPFPASLLVTTNKSSSSSSSENNHNSANQTNSNSSNSNAKSSAKANSLHNTSLSNLNGLTGNGSDLNSLLKKLSSGQNLLDALTSQNNSLNSLNSLNGLNNITSSLSNLNANSLLGAASNPVSILQSPMMNNLVGLSNLQSSNGGLNGTNLNSTNLNSNSLNGLNGSTSSSMSKLMSLRNEFKDRCIELCYKELVSLATIRSPAFKRLCQTLMLLGSSQSNSRQLQLPDISQLDDQLRDQYSALHLQIKSDLQGELAKNVGSALVCDSQDDLCILATYYISSKSWKMKEVILSADAYGNEINGFITSTLNDYHLNEEDKLGKFTFISRGGHFDGVQLCLTSVAHSIDHIMNNTIFFDDTYTEIIENCSLVCNELGIEVKLEPAVENVDWIIKYEIMRHVIINVDKFHLKDYPLNFDLIEFLVKLLTPFRNASCELRNCSTHPTLNHVLLWYYKIMKQLENDELKVMTDEEEEDDNVAFILKMKKSIRDAVEERFVLHPLHKIAVFLWPNFRTLKMLTAEERKAVHDEVREIIETRIAKDSDKRDNYQIGSSAKKARTDFGEWEESFEACQDELNAYINQTLPNCDETSILNWWRDHQTKFPKLAQLARWILSIPASVTLIEKFKLQNSPKLDEKVLFLHCNLFEKQSNRAD